MRRSRSAPGRGVAPVRAAISRTLSPRPRLKKKGSVMPVPIMAPQAGSEFRPAAEAELLHPVVGFLAERECIIEPQRPEWGFPNYSHTHRAAHMHGVVHRTRRRVGDARTEGRTETTRDDLAGRGECRRALIIPERAGVGEGGNLDPRILGQEIERRPELKTSAPIVRAAERVP